MGFRIAKVAVALLALVVAGGLAACRGPAIPLSAQAGSTVLLPVLSGGSASLVGFGGTTLTDYQRGALVFRLDNASGMELVTRATSTVAAAPTTQSARGTNASALQVVSLVDIPADAPLGTHKLYVTRRRIESGSPVEYSFASNVGQIQILPNQVTAGSETVTGQPSPFESLNCNSSSCTGTDISDVIPSAVPDPQLRLGLSAPVWAAELTVTYPANVIGVLDFLEPPATRSNNLATVWYQEVTPGSPGQLQVKAVAGTQAFSQLSLVFSLNDGTTAILDPNAVTVTIQKAFNQSGSPVSVSVLSKTIY